MLSKKEADLLYADQMVQFVLAKLDEQNSAISQEIKEAFEKRQYFGYSGFHFKYSGFLFRRKPGFNPGTRNPGSIPTHVDRVKVQELLGMSYTKYVFTRSPCIARFQTMPYFYIACTSRTMLDFFKKENPQKSLELKAQCIIFLFMSHIFS